MYSIMWAGLEPKEAGSSPPSDTAQQCQIVAIGLDSDLAAFRRVFVPEDPATWVAAFEREMRQLHDRLAATPYQHRVAPGEIFHPTIVLIGPSYGEIAFR